LIEGTVSQCANNDEEIQIVTADQTLFQIRLPQKGKYKFHFGEKVKAVVKPLRKADGKVFAKLVSLQ